MSGKMICLLLRIAAIAVVLLSVSLHAQWEGAVFDSVPGSLYSTFLSNQASCVDTSGNVHVVMREGQSFRRPSYICRDKHGNWHSFESLLETGKYWGNSRLIFNPTYNTIHILLNDIASDTNYVYHHYRDSDGWHSELIDSGYFFSANPDIAIDLNGVVHICWPENEYDTTSHIWTSRILYAENSTGDFVTRNISGDRQQEEPHPWRLDMFIAVEPDGKAHILEEHYPGLDYYYRDIHWANGTAYGSNWQADSLVISMQFGTHVIDMKTDPEGDLHLLADAIVCDPDGGGCNETHTYYYQRPEGADHWSEQFVVSYEAGSRCFIPLSLDDITIFYRRAWGNVTRQELRSATLTAEGSWIHQEILDSSYEVWGFHVMRDLGGRFAVICGYHVLLGPYYLRYYGPPGESTVAAGNQDELIVIPEIIRLSSYPNPFNAETSVTVSVDYTIQGREFEIVIYNLLGEVVRTLYQGKLSAGANHFSWNGTDHLEHEAGSGVYFIIAHCEGMQKVTKSLLLK